MARLTTRNEDPDETVPMEKVQIAPHLSPSKDRARGANNRSPMKHSTGTATVQRRSHDTQSMQETGSPRKSQASRSNLTRRTPQRSLKSDPCNSSLISQFEKSCNIHDAFKEAIERTSDEENKTRATPARRAKATVKYDHGQVKSDAPGDSDYGSDFNVPTSPVGRDFYVDNNASHIFESKPTKTFLQPSRFLLNGSGRTNQVNAVDQTTNSLKNLSTTPKKAIDQKQKARFHLSEWSSSFSEQDDAPAFLTFTPPATKKSPHRERTPPRPCTPPLESQGAGPASPSKPRLASPTKKKPKIPPTPHRPSVDAFWSAALVNSWNDQHSPRKAQRSPRKPPPSPPPATGDSDFNDSDVFPSPSTSPRNRPISPQEPSPTKTRDDHATAKAARKAFDAHKHSLATAFLAQLDARITSGQISSLTAPTGGVRLVWSKKLNSTAGRAHWRREAVRPVPGAASPARPSSAEAHTERDATVQYRHVASIELATKVITDRARLYNVLAHEFCHLANFMVSRVLDRPHGASFKAWAARVTDVFGGGEYGVEVTTRHDYEIEFRYMWRCVGNGGGGGVGGGSGREAVDTPSDDEEKEEQENGCGMQYSRHSRSIDPRRHTCGRCRGALAQVRPKPRGNAAAAAASPGKPCPTTGQRGSEYQTFVKSQFARVRAEMPPGSPVRDVMREVGVRYRGRGGVGVGIGEGEGKRTGTVEVIEISEDGDDGDDKEENVPTTREGKGKGEVDGVAKVLDFLSLAEG